MKVEKKMLVQKQKQQIIKAHFARDWFKKKQSRSTLLFCGTENKKQQIK